MRATVWMIAPVASLVGACAGAAPAHSGPEWEEPCDAGNLPSGAVPITGPPGSVDVIAGELGDCQDDGGAGGDFQDMFLIQIAIPSLFSARVDPSGTSFDTELWLFDLGGVGRLGNDDDPTQAPFSGFGSMADDGSGVTITAPGLYHLAISGFDSNPVSVVGEIFDQVTRIEVSGNDGIGGTAPISAWDAEGETGIYRILLTGVEFIVCSADVNGDGFVDFEDLALLLAAWGPCDGCPEDVDGTGFADFDDLLAMLSAWGRCIPRPQ